MINLSKALPKHKCISKLKISKNKLGDKNNENEILEDISSRKDGSINATKFDINSIIKHDKEK